MPTAGKLAENIRRSAWESVSPPAHPIPSRGRPDAPPTPAADADPCRPRTAVPGPVPPRARTAEAAPGTPRSRPRGPGPPRPHRPGRSRTPPGRREPERTRKRPTGPRRSPTPAERWTAAGRAGDREPRCSRRPSPPRRPGVRAPPGGSLRAPPDAPLRAPCRGPGGGLWLGRRWTVLARNAPCGGGGGTARRVGCVGRIGAASRRFRCGVALLSVGLDSLSVRHRVHRGCLRKSGFPGSTRGRPAGHWPEGTARANRSQTACTGQPPLRSRPRSCMLR